MPLAEETIPKAGKAIASQQWEKPNPPAPFPTREGGARFHAPLSF